MAKSSRFGRINAHKFMKVARSEAHFLNPNSRYSNKETGLL